MPRGPAPLEQAVLAEQRAGQLADLAGTVLDAGAGTGANLPHLRSASRVVAADGGQAWPGDHRTAKFTPPGRMLSPCAGFGVSCVYAAPALLAAAITISRREA